MEWNFEEIGSTTFLKYDIVKFLRFAVSQPGVPNDVSRDAICPLVLLTRGK